MLRNLPESHKGSTSPLKVNLEKGMCIEIQYNGGIMRRGIVYEDPGLTMSYMWWQTNTRYVRGEVPRCTTLHEGIPKERIPGLTVVPVAFFDSWLASVPFSIRFHFGEVKRGRKPKTPHQTVGTSNPRPSQRSKPTAPVMARNSDPSVMHEPLPIIQGVVEDPPWSPPQFHVEEIPVQGHVDQGLTGLRENNDEGGVTRKVRRDKGNFHFH